jgi:TolB protein
LTADSAQEGSIAWSPDGNRVLYSVSAQDTARLYSVQADGTGRREILHVPGRNPMISPDGRKVIYAVGGWQDMQVAIADLDGSHARQISPPGAAYYNHRFSPDGSLVAASRSAPSDMQVWVFGVDGKNARPLTHFTQGRPQAPAWSPDGRKIVVQGTVPDSKDPKKHVGNIWVVDLQNGEGTKLAEHTEPYLDETPSWFPDGKHIAFQSDRTGRWEVWVMNADGTGARQVTR